MGFENKAVLIVAWMMLHEAWVDLKTVNEWKETYSDIGPSNWYNWINHLKKGAID